MDQSNRYFLITDVGSTTTKAVLISNTAEKPELIGIAQAETTVEEPHNDVRFGVWKAISKLAQEVKIPLLAEKADAGNLGFAPGIKYLSTSSAGGGLQILVIGLTLFDSASSARRAAYGAGGILLDVFAIDDKRKPTEQMLAMRNLHPDMILLCGGVDGGAIAGVLRLAEILRIAKPLPKFATDRKIPTLYAGNVDVQDLIKGMISEDFDLVILPNLRPTLSSENLKPTQDMIQKLFMENVMERAPGYADLKKLVYSDILPTPMGVMKSLINATEAEKRNFFAFDIGGATTDVFSYIKSHYLRTVSANLGMSYSALNVMSEAGVESLVAALPQGFTEEEVRNYIGNKTLYPTCNPNSSREKEIEYVLATHALRLALNQHQEMHYNTAKIGFLDALKSASIDNYESKFDYELIEASYHFYPSEIDVLIGAGGIFSHAESDMQSAAILINGFDAHGVTELWLDKSFITPHLGVLATTDEKSARDILKKECIKKIAIHVRPHVHPKANKAVLEITYQHKGSANTMLLMPEKVVMLNCDANSPVTLKPLGKSLIGLDDSVVTLRADLPLIIDTRIKVDGYSTELTSALGINAQTDAEPGCVYGFHNDNVPIHGCFTKTITLPFRGDILVSENETVEPDSIVAMNKFNPPRLFIVQPYLELDNVNEKMVRASIKVSPGERIDFDDVLRFLPEKPEKKWVGQEFKSPVRGKVEFIDYNSGLVVLSEIQDYSDKPVRVNLAELMECKPKKALSCMKKSLGEFVYHGDLLAARIQSSDNQAPRFIHSPTTGIISAIDKEKAIVTIQFQLKPTNYHAHVKGLITKVEENYSATIAYTGTKMYGKLGMGRKCHGEFVFAATVQEMQALPITGKIVGLGFAPDASALAYLIKQQATGMVCPGLSQAELVALAGNELGVLNTGNENLPISIVITERFAANELHKEYEKAFRGYIGKQCHLETHTRIRAGVARPYICFMD